MPDPSQYPKVLSEKQVATLEKAQMPKLQPSQAINAFTDFKQAKALIDQQLANPAISQQVDQVIKDNAKLIQNLLASSTTNDERGKLKQDMLTALGLKTGDNYRIDLGSFGLMSEVKDGKVTLTLIPKSGPNGYDQSRTLFEREVAIGN